MDRYKNECLGIFLTTETVRMNSCWICERIYKEAILLIDKCLQDFSRNTSVQEATWERFRPGHRWDEEYDVSVDWFQGPVAGCCGQGN
jgi:hypothetical protein